MKLSLPFFLFLFAGLALVLTGCLSSDSSKIEIGPNKAALGTPTPAAGQAQVLSDETLEPEGAVAGAEGLSEADISEEAALDDSSLAEAEFAVSDEALEGEALDDSGLDSGLLDEADSGLEAGLLDADSLLDDSVLDEPVLEEEPA